LTLNKFHHSFLSVIIAILSIWLFYPTLKWIGKAYLGLYDLLNMVLLAGLVYLLYSKEYDEKQNWKLKSYQFSPLPFTIAVIGVILWATLHHLLSINIFSAIGFLIYAYGAWGLYTNRRTWFKSLIPFILLSMTLPFGSIMEIYMGFPLRMIAVKTVASILTLAGFEHVTEHTIIATENGAAQVDFSCSGLKGIWSGLLFYFILTWLQQLRISAAWLITIIGLLFGIFLSNLIRIITIILLTTVLGLQTIATILHAPLGIVGYIFVCAGVYFLTKTTWFSQSKVLLNNPILTTDKQEADTPRWKILTSNILLIGLLIGILQIPIKRVESKSEIKAMVFPSNWKVKKLPLREEELSFFKEQGSNGNKYAFSVGDTVSGSILILKSSQWKGHHNPEFCIRAGGNRIDAMETKLVHAQLPVKWLKVNGDANACYWFQNKESCTDDYSTRIWSDIQNESQDWVLVSVVFNRFENNHNQWAYNILDSLHIKVKNQFFDE